MKISNYNASILFDTNRVVSSSNDSWQVIKKGSLFRIGEDEEFYTIEKTNQIYFIKDFEVISDNRLKINSNVGLNIMVGDILTISYKEYELWTVLDVLEKGKGYKVDDEVILEGGDLSLDVSNNLTYPAKFNITEVDESGGIILFGLKDNGKYINSPEKTVKINGGNGNGAVFEVEFKPVDDRKVLEIAVSSVNPKEKDITIVDLDYSIPAKIRQGKLSLKKWEMFLDRNYRHFNKINCPYSISYDFSPNYNFPKMLKNTFTPELVYNQFLLQLDGKLKEFENKIVKLENCLPSSSSSV
ncbi:MAG: hypothetical protein AABY22_24085 [Nanoarchaeota archaeon]